jgi:hypothetical protein
MRSVLLPTLLALLIVPFAPADTIRTVNVQQTSFVFFPNDGSGDNASLQLNSPGTMIFSIAGTNCFDWCTPFTLEAPGSELSPSTDIFFDGLGQVTIRGKSFDPDSSAIFPASLDPQGTIFFPTNGESFSASVPASLSSPLTMSLSDGSTALLYTSKGTLTLNFTFMPGNNDTPSGYQFSDARFSAIGAVPEPGSVVLMLTGLGITGVLRRRVKRV